jgi:hypothetical protein
MAAMVTRPMLSHPLIGRRRALASGCLQIYVALQLTPKANLREYRMMIDTAAALNCQ